MLGFSELKSYARGRRYVSEVMKYLQEKPEAIASEGLLERIVRPGFMHDAAGSKNADLKLCRNASLLPLTTGTLDSSVNFN